SLGSLDAIRKKVNAQNKANGGVKELTGEELKLCWGMFIEKLNARKNHSAVTNFKMAELRILDNNSIEIITGNNIQQKFIEQERAQLVDDLQQYFCNRQLTYNVIIIEKEEAGEVAEKPLSSREQYLKIIEEYPLVKELKDRLRLELDY
ncbi:MAG: DNA polymerase III subunit gamma/tau, partial [Ferruginibacter sp.]